MSNNNQELLDWAVENIKEWNDEFTHLRGDSSNTSVFFSKGNWNKGTIYWSNKENKDLCWFYGVDTEITFNPPQVITKQEWLEAKKEKENMSNEFNLKDLKTGQRITLEDGTFGVVYTNCATSICSDDEKYSICFKPNHEDIFSCLEYYLENHGSIVKVESPYGVGDFMKINVRSSYKLIWERPAKETPEQAKQRELREQYEATKKQLEELGKQLGIE